MNDKLQVINKLLDFMHSSPTAYQAASTIVGMLKERGFRELKEDSAWKLKSGGAYYVQRNNSTVAAFRMGLKSPSETGFLIAGAHTDSPGLKIKFPLMGDKAQSTLSVEVYGGPIISTWLDRELSVAGIVNVKKKGIWVSEQLVIPEPVAVIPNLAIHLNRDINKGFEYNKQSHLKVLFPGKSLPELICEKLNIDKSDIGDGDLFLTDNFKGSILSGKVFVSPRIDNLAMCHGVLDALLDVHVSDSTQIGVFYDNEEIGSRTFQGADGSFFSELLERIVVVSGGSGDDYYRAKARSFMLSADGAHAVHPNFKDKHDPDYAPQLNKGPVLKLNAGYSYATNSAGAAVFSGICSRAGVKYQRFIGRSDMPSGGTIGTVSSSILGIRTVDIGNPMLAMHSIRETAGVEDHVSMIKVLSEFYRNGIS